MEQRITVLFDDEEIPELLKNSQCVLNAEGEVNLQEDLDFLTKEAEKKLEKLQISQNCVCTTCGLDFENFGDQRIHFRNDVHSYNVKQKLLGLPPITAKQYCLIDERWSEGSDAERSSTSEEDKNLIGISTQHCKGKKVYLVTKTGKIIALYECLFSADKKVHLSQHELVKSVRQCHQRSMWVIILVGGGHFAGAVFEGMSLIVHKTVHSYTVRSKQGGSQRKKDATGRHPKSAGASLRRYNEESFAQHIQEVLTQWKKQFDACNLIFYHAAGHNKKLLFGDGGPLKKGDLRIRSISIPTHKASFKEVKRVHSILTTVEIYDSREVYERNLLAEQKLPGPKVTKPKSLIDRAKPRKSPTHPMPEMVVLSESSEGEENFEMISDVLNISFCETLEEYGVTITPAAKKRKIRLSRAQKGKGRHKAEPSLNINCSNIRGSTSVKKIQSKTKEESTITSLEQQLQIPKQKEMEHGSLGLSCNQCLKTLGGIVPFEYSEFKFCSIDCLKMHRRNKKN